MDIEMTHDGPTFTNVMSIRSDGNVGIGTTTPAVKLDVNGSANFSGNVAISATNSLSFGSLSRQMLNLFGTSYGIGVQSSTVYTRSDGGGFAWFRSGTHSDTQYNAGSGGTVDMVLNLGTLGLGTTNPSSSYKIHAVGKIFATDDIIGFSDKRLKYNLNIIEDALSKIHKLNGYTFDMDGCNKTRTGLIAQEVLEILPEAVHKDENGYYSLAYGNLAGFFVEAIKEIDKKYTREIKDLQEQIKELQSQL
jgi:hypothetical protein